jgi:hypothetical protein
MSTPRFSACVEQQAACSPGSRSRVPTPVRLWAIRTRRSDRARREVAAVAGDQRASFGYSKLEYMRVGEPLIGGVFSEREHVVASLAQLSRDSPRREVCI